MKIGQIEIPQLCRLAPMAAISNAPFRLIAKECGSGLTTTEEIDAFALIMETPRSGDMAAYYPQERPLAMQLLGKDPQALIRAAVRCEELGADIVDLNMGCPMPKITGKGKGAALMKDALGSPWIFDESFDTLEADAQRAYKDRIIRRHMALIQEHCFDRYAMSQMKKHLAWYTEGLVHAADCRARIFQTKSPGEVWEVFQEYWEASALAPLVA